VGSERAQALGDLHPVGHLVLDFRDPRGALERIATFATSYPLAAVVAADDDGAMLAARACELLRIESHGAEAVRTARDKLRTREAFAAAGLPTPEHFLAPLAGDVAALAARAPYPCVLKPLGLSASRGVIRANDPPAFRAAFARIAAMLRREPAASPDEPPADALLVERFVPGREVAVEGLVTRGSLRVLALFDKPDPLDGPFFEETIYVTPSRLVPEAQTAIAAAAARAARSLGLAHGPVHAELRWDGAAAWPLEIAPRSIGGLCSRALRFSGGETLETLLLRHALGGDVSGIEREPAASGVMMIPIPRAGILRRVDGIETARAQPGVDEVRMTMPPGARLVPLPEGSRYLGFVFARGEAPAAAEAALRAAHRALRFEIETASHADASEGTI
jgi:biotin carboxylase